MFHIHGIRGRVFSGTLEQLRQQHLVAGVARVRRVAPVLTDASPSTAAPSGGSGGSAHALGVVAVPEFALLLIISALAGRDAGATAAPAGADRLHRGRHPGRAFPWPAVFGIVTAHDQVALLAEIGVTVLLFVVGLKLDLHHIRHIGPVGARHRPRASSASPSCSASLSSC
jgi:hypothetical protein